MLIIVITASTPSSSALAMDRSTLNTTNELKSTKYHLSLQMERQEFISQIV